MTDIHIPERVTTHCRNIAGGIDWLARLPNAVLDLRQRWSLTLGPPVEEEVSSSWVAPCLRPDGTAAILKVALPHMEAEHELEGLLFWAGDPTVLVFEADIEQNAMLLERCLPGTALRGRSETEQDLVIADLLRKLWRMPAHAHPFRPLSEMIAYWIQRSLEAADRWPDAGLAQEGLHILEELVNTAPDEVLLATDLHAGNVLRALRAPWLVIDPKPFLGDPAYDATQHLLNCQARLRANPNDTIHRFADLLGVDPERVRLWTFARLAAVAHDDLQGSQDLARLLMA